MARHADPSSSSTAFAQHPQPDAFRAKRDGWARSISRPTRRPASRTSRPRARAAPARRRPRRPRRDPRREPLRVGGRRPRRSSRWAPPPCPSTRRSPPDQCRGTSWPTPRRRPRSSRPPSSSTRSRRRARGAAGADARSSSWTRRRPDARPVATHGWADVMPARGRRAPRRPTRWRSARWPTPCSPTTSPRIIYTSGTTGEPKGAMLSHANICVQRATRASMSSTWAHRHAPVVPAAVPHLRAHGRALHHGRARRDDRLRREHRDRGRGRWSRCGRRIMFARAALLREGLHAACSRTRARAAAAAPRRSSSGRSARALAPGARPRVGAGRPGCSALAARDRRPARVRQAARARGRAAALLRLGRRAAGARGARVLLRAWASRSSRATGSPRPRRSSPQPARAASEPGTVGPAHRPASRSGSPRTARS